MDLLLFIEQKEQGPFNADQIKKLVASKQVGPTTLAWRDGMPDWQPLASFPEYSHLSTSTSSAPASKRSKMTTILCVIAGGVLFWGILGWVFWKSSTPEATSTKVSERVSTLNPESSTVPETENLPKTLQALNRWYEQPVKEENAALLILDGLELLQVDNQIKNSNIIPILGKGKLPSLGAPIPGAMKIAIAEVVRKNAASMESLKRCTSLKRSRYPIDFSSGMDTKIPHLANIRTASKLCALAAVVAADSKQESQAVERMLTGIALCQSLEYEPVSISQLVRMASINIVVAALEQVVNRVQVSPESLKRLQEGLNRMEQEGSQGTATRRAFVGEWLMGKSLFTLPPEKFKVAVSLLLPGSSQEEQQRFISTARKNAKEDILFYDETFAQIFAAHKEPFPTRSSTSDIIENASNESNRRRLPISTMWLSALGGIITKEEKQLAGLRLACIAVALESYRAFHANQYPDTLQALGPDIMANIPVDPFNGETFQYVKTTAGYKLGAVGKDIKAKNTKPDEVELTFEVVVPPSAIR